jgi:hypothetical protein
MALFFKAWVVAVVALFTLAGLLGWRLGTEPREKAPTTLRSSPGGYRSYHFWHSGSSGGK